MQIIGQFFDGIGYGFDFNGGQIRSQRCRVTHRQNGDHQHPRTHQNEPQPHPSPLTCFKQERKWTPVTSLQLKVLRYCDVAQVATLFCPSKSPPLSLNCRLRWTVAAPARFHNYTGQRRPVILPSVAGDWPPGSPRRTRKQTTAGNPHRRIFPALRSSSRTARHPLPTTQHQRHLPHF